ncbi:MAG: hypothetical protein HY683_10520 [Chloroflexi bacterium]|nr:hypothetical protein [Chloroflexota bacterium]
MARRKLIFAVAFPAVLALTIGLAAGVLKAPTSLYSGPAGPLSSTSVALPTVVTAGLLDGINPCAFTVLLLFAATLASMYRGVGEAPIGAMRTRLLLFGGAFVLAIFATYLTLGTGLLRASTVLTQNHVGARLGALASVFLGLWMVKDSLLPGWGPRLRAPSFVGNLLKEWSQRATLTAMFGLGILVGLCTVPCSGAVYLAILSMLALQDNFVRSYLYLVLYNVMFIVPLVAILAAVSARPALNRLAHWNLHHREGVRLGLGTGVVVLGLAILATV